MCRIGIPGPRLPISGCDRTDEQPEPWAPKSGNYDAGQPLVVALLQDLYDSLTQQTAERIPYADESRPS